MIEVVYFDLDGVLADFVGAFEKWAGKSIEDAYADGTFKALKNKFSANPDFFANFAELPRGMALLNIYLDTPSVRVEILTSAGSNHTDVISKGKREWWKSLEDRGIVPKGIKMNITAGSVLKAEYAHPKALLIDDRRKAIDPFVAAGGNALHFVG